jgi:hypothetical protein
LTYVANALSECSGNVRCYFNLKRKNPTKEEQKLKLITWLKGEIYNFSLILRGGCGNDDLGGRSGDLASLGGGLDP